MNITEISNYKTYNLSIYGATSDRNILFRASKYSLTPLMEYSDNYSISMQEKISRMIEKAPEGKIYRIILPESKPNILGRIENGVNQVGYGINRLLRRAGQAPKEPLYKAEDILEYFENNGKSEFIRDNRKLFNWLTAENNSSVEGYDQLIESMNVVKINFNGHTLSVGRNYLILNIFHFSFF